MPGNLSGPTLLVILFIVLLLFGAPKLPALARSLGQSMKILKKEVSTDSGAKGEQAGDDATATSQADAAAQARTEAQTELEQARAEAAAAKAEAEELRRQAQSQAVPAPETPASPPEGDRPAGA